jgi:hypothetical protein
VRAPAVCASDADLEMFSAKARRGEIPETCVGLLANCFAACRAAQVAMGPGYEPLHAMLAAVPERYARNFLRSVRRAR